MDKTTKNTLIYLLGCIQWAVSAAIELLSDGQGLPAPGEPLPPSDPGDNGDQGGECVHPLESRKPIRTMGDSTSWFCTVPGCGFVNEG